MYYSLRSFPQEPGMCVFQLQKVTKKSVWKRRSFFVERTFFFSCLCALRQSLKKVSLILSPSLYYLSLSSPLIRDGVCFLL